MNRTKHDSVDIYTVSGVTPAWFEDLKQVYVFADSEHGSAPKLAFKSIMGRSEPDAFVCSHLISEMGFNSAPKLDDIGWEMYFYDKHTLFVCITEWPQTALFPPEDSKKSWIYTYPVVRDLLDFIIRPNGVMNSELMLTYFSSSTMHDVLESDKFQIIPPTEAHYYSLVTNTIIKHDSKGRSKKKKITDEEFKLFLTPPTWMFPKLAQMIGYLSPSILIVGNTPDEKIDEVAARTLMDWFDNFDPNYEYMAEYANELNDQIEKFDKMQSDFQALMNVEKPANDMLWG